MKLKQKKLLSAFLTLEENIPKEAEADAIKGKVCQLKKLTDKKKIEILDLVSNIDWYISLIKNKVNRIEAQVKRCFRSDLNRRAREAHVVASLDKASNLFLPENFIHLKAKRFLGANLIPLNRLPQTTERLEKSVFTKASLLIELNQLLYLS